MRQRKIVSAFAIIFVVLFSSVSALKVLHATPTSGLSIVKSADKKVLESDSNDNTVTYNIVVKNNTCEVDPVDGFIVFDRSDSMLNDNKLTGAKSAAKDFLDVLDFNEDRIGLVSYADKARLESPLTSNKGTLVSKVNGFDTHELTNVYDGLRVAHDSIKSNVRANTQRVIVIFSDGRANTPNGGPEAKRLALEKAKEVKQGGYRIIAVAFGNDADKDLMRQVASSTADFHFAENGKSMRDVFQSIAKQLKGISANTVITEDITSLLEHMTLVDAGGAKVQGNKLSWNIGDLACGQEASVSLKLKAKPGLAGKVTKSNTASVSNSSNQTTNSNKVDVDIVGPILGISVTDNKTIAQACEDSTYVVTVSNTGPGWARGAEVINTIPSWLDMVPNSASDGGKDIGKNQVRWVLDLAPGQTKELTVQAKVRCDIPEGYTTVADTATISNDGVTKQATDNTQIFKAAPPLPNFELGVCKEEVGDKLRLKFSYVNKLTNAQELEVSRLEPAATVQGTVPATLLSGEHKDIFIGEVGSSESLRWLAEVRGVSKLATGDKDSPVCDGGSVERPPDIPPIEEKERFIGTPRNNNRPTDNNNDKPKLTLNNIGVPASCYDAQVFAVQFTANDGFGVITAAQYSLDNGRSWYPITNVAGIGTRLVTGFFRTPTLGDGNYQIKVRAIDNNGNIGESASETRYINCQGIVIGSTQFNQFSQLSPLNNKGMVRAIAGYPVEFSVAIAGGPATAELRTKDSNGTELVHALTFNADLELWQTKFNLQNAGVYTLEVRAAEADGASTKRSTNSVEILSAGVVSDQNGNRINNASVNVYYRRERSARWQPWNIGAFNTTIRTEEGRYAVFVEPGWYYLEVSHPDFYTTTSREVYVGEYTIVAQDITMFSKHNLGHWVQSITQLPDVAAIPQELTQDLNALLGNTLPEISLSTADQTITSKEIVAKAKPAIIATWTDWSTIPSAQLTELNQLYKASQQPDAQIQVYPVSLLEGREENENVIRRGEYDLPIYKPTELSFFDRMFIISAPQYYFVDADGVIRDIQVGNFYSSSLYQHLLQVTQFSN